MPATVASGEQLTLLTPLSTEYNSLENILDDVWIDVFAVIKKSKINL